MAPQPLLSTSINININICPNILRTFRWTLQWSFGSESLCEQLDEHTVTLTTTGLMLASIEMTIHSTTSIPPATHIFRNPFRSFDIEHFHEHFHPNIGERLSNMSIVLSFPSCWPTAAIDNQRTSLRNSCWGFFQFLKRRTYEL